MSALLHLRIAGILLLALASVHVTFPKRFDWKNDLGQLTLLNRQMFYVHCLFIVLVLMMIGILSSVFGQALLDGGPLARVVLWGLIVFWGIRLFTQIFIYDKALWAGDTFRTVVHFVFTGFWTYLVFVYAYALTSVRP